MPWDEDDAFLADDDDTDIESDGDVCEKCDHTREMHEDGAGPCQCGRCKRFK